MTGPFVRLQREHMEGHLTSLQTPGQSASLAWQARLIHGARAVVVGALGGLLAGLLAGGIGSRLAMRVTALEGGDSIVGLTTDNGNIVGKFTVDGTLGLLFFGGALPGLVGGVLYAVIRRWLPGHRRWHGSLFGILLLLVFGAVIINSGNPDFAKFGSPIMNVAMFVLLFPIFGVLVAPFTRWADRLLPAPEGMNDVATFVYLGVSGLLLFLVILGGFGTRGIIGLPLLTIVLALAFQRRLAAIPRPVVMAAKVAAFLIPSAIGAFLLAKSIIEIL